jgi:hypothetical protein
MLNTFISTQTPQQPPEPDLVMLKVEAVCFSKKLGCTIPYGIQTEKIIKYASKNALIMKRCYVKIFLRYYLKKKKRQKQCQCQYIHF